MSGKAVTEALALAVAGETVPEALMASAVQEMMTEDCPQVAAAGLLTALSVRGERPAEIVATAQVLRRRGLKVAAVEPENLLDTCGTGGTGKSLFNCSTCCALVAAAAGVRVAKHGNRASTRASGSADLLERAGVVLTLTPAQAASCLEQVGLAFLFAPAFHPAMRHMAPIRRELGIKTIFNLVGPLSNPAGARRQVLGVPAPKYLRPMAEALRQLGAVRALVVHSHDGLDEISPAAPTDVIELSPDGELTEYTLNPADFGPTESLENLTVTSSTDSLEQARTLLAGEAHPAVGMVALNAGAALWIGGRCDSLKDGVQLAHQTLAAGAGLELLEKLAATSTRLAAEQDA